MPFCRSFARSTPVNTPAKATVWTKIPAMRKLMYEASWPPLFPTLMAPPKTKLKRTTNMIGLRVTSSSSSGVRLM
jgi:hypothetical protein